MQQQQKQELFYSDLDQISSVQYQDGTDSFVVFTLRDNKYNIVGSIVYEVKELDTNPASGSSSDFQGKKYNREHVCVYLNNGSKIIYCVNEFGFSSSFLGLYQEITIQNLKIR